MANTKHIKNITPSSLLATTTATSTLLLILIMFATTTNALVPYTGRSSSLWDIMQLPLEDPFRILEQTPHTIPKVVDDDLALMARVDWKETATEHVITLDIPGMKKEDIKVEVDENRVLKISGERKLEEEVKGDKWHRAERTSGKFWRQFRLPSNVDLDHIKAHLENGVLRINVPKIVGEEKRQPKVIDIGGSDAAAASVSQDIKTEL